MAIERLVGLFVHDDVQYQYYRDAMAPILKKYDGGFRYDFKVSEVLKSEVVEKINRVFIIYFKDEDLMADFFSDPDYLVIRNKYFDSSVSATTEISKYHH